MGEFPQGEAAGQSGTESGADVGGAGEPGFEDVAGAAGSESGAEGTPGAASEGEPGFEVGVDVGGGLPGLLDEPSFEEILGAMEDAMGDAPPGAPGDGSNPGAGSFPGEGSQPRTTANGNPGTGSGGLPQGNGGRGPLTPAEQVAILDARLEQGTGEFDAIILEEQAAQREAARKRTTDTPPAEQRETSPAGGGGSNPIDDGIASAGGYSTGGGMGGASAGGGGGQIPQNTAKYPAPDNIPTGNDDDVVARQLREAAMREPDPAIREKLWDEYRKYKGISP